MNADRSNLTPQSDKSNTVAHTPGRWLWELMPSGDQEIENGPEYYTEACIGVEDPARPGEMKWPLLEGRIESDNAASDLRLIAAAPDLLEALKAVLAEEMIYTGAIVETLEKSGQHPELTAKILAAIQRAGSEQ